MMTKHGQFHWNELLTLDIESAKKFYGDALDWTFVPTDMPDGQTYTLAHAPGEEVAVGGLFTPQDPDVQARLKSGGNVWFCYIHVDDVDARVAKAEAAGGKVLHGPFDVSGVGRIALVQDSSGGGLGFIAPAAHD